ncbi:hypothetical protein [Methylobacterium sp. GXF4]|uniref:hypothetical protein n=1 Tax=Methylobacterium sp. GXF4 TaxID=1096546 RepID=UPI001AEC1410|nr:hypothetical protein [Methylobacterium sp. GXF4]
MNGTVSPGIAAEHATKLLSRGTSDGCSMPLACVTVIVVTQEVLADVDDGLFADAPECVTGPTYLAAPLTRAIPVRFIDLTGCTGPTRERLGPVRTRARFKTFHDPVGETASPSAPIS